jgi:hypothetical protein
VTPEVRDARKPEIAKLAGTWTSVGFRNAMPTEWGEATGCELTIRKYDPENDKGNVWRDPPLEGEWDVTLHLVRSKNRWRAPDSSPGWIDKKATLWMGPLGSALRFDLLLTREGKLVLSHEGGVILLARPDAAKQSIGHKEPPKTGSK